MRNLKLALLASATFVGVGVGSAAHAADLIIDTPPPMVVSDYATGYEWNGPYAGLWISGETGGIYALGADFGVNTMIDSNLLVGVEGDVAWLNNDTWQGQVHGKFGFAADSIAFYGLAGLGYNSATEAYAPVGLGVEFGVTEAVSLKAEYQYQWDFDTSADNAHVGKVGLNFHF